MQQYNVPQFVDTQDKILGPLTIPQFFAFVTGVFFVFLLWLAFSFGLLFWLVGIPLFILTLFISFGSLNGQPVLYNALPLVGYIIAPKKRVFIRQGPEMSSVTIKAPVAVEAAPDETVESRLKRLAYVLDQKTAEEEILTGQITRPIDTK
jgi:vacuolar-type H+-ATPase subunit I/STV1